MADRIDMSKIVRRDRLVIRTTRANVKRWQTMTRTVAQLLRATRMQPTWFADDKDADVCGWLFPDGTLLPLGQYERRVVFEEDTR